jgi:predicted ATPase
MIKTFRVQNYKALRDVTLDLTPIHLLIGPNDSGKTSMLEAMRAYCRSIDETLPQAFGSRWSGSDLVSDGDVNRLVCLGADYRVSPIESPHITYDFACRFHDDNLSVDVVSEQILYAGIKYEIKRRIRPRGDRTSLQHASKQSGTLPDWTDPPTNTDFQHALRVSMSGVQVLRWIPRLLSLPCALDADAGFDLMPSGFGLARVLDAIIGYNPRLFLDDLVEEYRRIFPNVLEVKLRPEPGYVAKQGEDEYVPSLKRQDGKGIVIRFKGVTHEVPAAHLSEGMLIILAYLSILYSPEPPRLLLVEEPENGIHPARLKQVISLLREIVKKRNLTQIILTSHSPYIVSEFEPEEVTLCRKDEHGYVQTRRLSDSEIVRRDRGIFSLGEIWPAEEEAIFRESRAAKPNGEAAP